MLKYLIVLLFPALSFAQISSTPCRDSVDIWIDLLSQDSLIYRPDGDSLITLIAKSENKRGILFLLDHLHERDERYAPMLSSMQIALKQKYYIEGILKDNCDMWILFACSLNYLKNKKNIENSTMKKLKYLLLSKFNNKYLKYILNQEYMNTIDENIRKNIQSLNDLIEI